MKSLTSQYEEQLEYINEKLEQFTDGELTLIGIELDNNEQIFGLIDLAEDDLTVILPVNLVETDIDAFSGKISYSLVTYKHFADPLSELILIKEPLLMYGPRDSIISMYLKYWLNGYWSDFAENEDNVDNKSSNYDIMSKTKS